MKYKALFLDLDGTILDTLDDLTDSVNFALENNGFAPRTKKEIRSFLGNGSTYLIKKAIPHEVEESVFEKVFKEYKTCYQNNCSIKTKPYDGVLKFLKNAKENGLKLVMITNKPQEIAEILVDKYFENMFELVYGQSSKIKTKPDPESIDLAKKQLNLKNSEIFYIGDSLVDLKTAEVSELDYAIVAYGFADKKDIIAAGANNIVDRIDDIWKMIA